VVVTFKNGVYICNCKFEDRHKPKEAGFIFESTIKKWTTRSNKNAACLRKFFDSKAKEHLFKKTIRLQPWTGSISIDPRLDPYQAKAVKFSLLRNHSYLALEQGLGKTPIAINIINNIVCDVDIDFFKEFTAVNVLVVVPPFLVTNWLREIETWGLGYVPIEIREGNDQMSFQLFDDHITIVADSLLQNEKIINLLKQKDYQLLIVDEAHRFNNPESKRTKGLYDVKGNCDKVVLLSGTPMPNRPIELYKHLAELALGCIGYKNRYEYGVRYCAAYHKKISKDRYVNGRNIKGRTKWNDLGSCNEAELSYRIKNFMMVEKFDDHVKLKKTHHRVIVLDAKLNTKIIKLEKLILANRSLEDLTQKKIKSSKYKKSIGDIAEYRKEIAKIKIKPAVDYIINLLEVTKSSILIFAWHTELILELERRLSNYSPLIIYGGVSNKLRVEREDAFQRGESRLMIANISCMVGLNLPRANRCLFVESSWVPGDNDQAYFRMKRRGQTKQMYIEHLLLANTLDEYQTRRVIEKRDTINKIIQGD